MTKDTFDSWLNNEFLPAGGFISDFKKHAMRQAWLAGVLVRPNLSRSAVEAVRSEVQFKKKTPHCW